MESKNYRASNLLRLGKYIVGGLSGAAIYMAGRKGPRRAVAYLVRTGRMRERIMGYGLPGINVRQLLKKIRGVTPFNFEVHPLCTANISADPRETYSGYLVALIAAAAEPLHAVEVGTGSGKGSMGIAAQLRNGGRLLTLDAPREWEKNKSDDIDLTEVNNFNRKNVINDWPDSHIAQRIDQVRADSRSMDYAPYNRKFDFAFIDGSHSYQAVKADTERIVPYLNEGATVLWHDYSSSQLSHGVTQYLQEYSKRTEWPVYVIEYTTLAVQVRR